MTELRTSEVLDLAADEIQRRGWAWGGNAEHGDDPWGFKGGSVCLEGAIFAVLGWSEIEMSATGGVFGLYGTCPAYRAVADYLGGRYVPESPNLVEGEWANMPERLFGWNDRDERTADEVIALLRAAAAVERAKEESLEHSEVTA